MIECVIIKYAKYKKKDKMYFKPILIFSFIVWVMVSTIHAAPLHNVSVLEFSAKQVSFSEAQSISDLFSAGLVNSGKYNVLDRANMQKILEEQAFQHTGCTDSSCAVEIGKLLNMDFMFTGSLMKLGEKYFVTVNFTCVESGKVIDSFKSDGFLMQDIEIVLSDLIEKFTDFKGTKRKRRINASFWRPGAAIEGGGGAIAGLSLFNTFTRYLSAGIDASFDYGPEIIANTEFDVLLLNAHALGSFHILGNRAVRLDGRLKAGLSALRIDQQNEFAFELVPEITAGHRNAYIFASLSILFTSRVVVTPALGAGILFQKKPQRQ